MAAVGSCPSDGGGGVEVVGCVGSGIELQWETSAQKVQRWCGHSERSAEQLSLVEKWRKWKVGRKDRPPSFAPKGEHQQIFLYPSAATSLCRPFQSFSDALPPLTHSLTHSLAHMPQPTVGMTGLLSSSILWMAGVYALTFDGVTAGV